MTKPLILIDVPTVAKLTPRQAKALEFLRLSGQEGTTPQRVGRVVHSWNGHHAIDQTCDWCKSTGNELLKALRKKGLAKQRRVNGRTFWRAVGVKADDSFGEIPF